MKVLMYDNTQRETFWRKDILGVWVIENAMYQQLGRIKKKNDGRWNWFYKSCKNSYVKEIEPTKLQGTCATEQEAREQLEKMWEYK